MAKLSKSIGFVTYPKLGMPTPHSSMMETPKLSIPARYLGSKKPQTGVVEFTQNKNKANPVPPEKQKMSGYVNTDSKYALIGNQGHETQHTVFAKIKQRHGQDVTTRLIDYTLSVLSPVERKFMDYINVGANKYPAADRNEELIANFHNYLQDPKVRKLVHNKKGLSAKAALNLHNLAKHAWQKIRNHAQTLDLQTINKSELSKREPPKFPKLGITDSRKQTELISDPKRLKTKLLAISNQNARKQYEGGVYAVDPVTGKPIKVPADPKTIEHHQTKERDRAYTKLDEAVTTEPPKGPDQGVVVGTQSGPHSYALSGILRPSFWPHPVEDESHGTKQHEEFHAQMNRVGEKFGKIARTALADNLYNALSNDQRAAIDHLQEHFAGRSYEEKNPSIATEEKLARLFNVLNSPTTRNSYFNHLDLKTHEMPAGGEAPVGTYVIPGMSRLTNKSHLHSILKDAHRNLLAAGEVANENWLKHGHTNSDYLRPEPGMVKSETESQALNHMHGYSQSVQLMSQAAKFLSGRPIDEAKFRNALLENDGDLKVAVLIGHGLEATKSNIKALLGLTKVQELGKNLFDQKYIVRAGHPEGGPVAKLIQDGINRGEVERINLGGKHSAGSLLVKDEHSENWLIKPESFKESPASGIQEEQATQSEREAAFYHIAASLGLQHSMPQAEFVFLNDKPAAAIKMVPFSWMNLDSAKKAEPNVATMALEPYRQSGELFKWAVLDYVLGNSDSHGANMMVSEKDDGHKLVLIDHGSTFAGDKFAPGIDNNTFVPYYMRTWTNRKWSGLTPEEKLRASPRATAEKEKEVFHWLLGINPERIGAIMQRYGINAQPSLARLAKLKNCKEPIDSYLAKVWNGLA